MYIRVEGGEVALLFHRVTPVLIIDEVLDGLEVPITPVIIISTPEASVLVFGLLGLLINHARSLALLPIKLPLLPPLLVPSRLLHDAKRSGVEPELVALRTPRDLLASLLVLGCSGDGVHFPPEPPPPDERRFLYDLRRATSRNRRDRRHRDIDEPLPQRRARLEAAVLR